MIDQTLVNVLNYIKNQGVRLNIHNGKLLYSPCSFVDSRPDLKAMMIKHKEAIFSTLKACDVRQRHNSRGCQQGGGTPWDRATKSQKQGGACDRIQKENAHDQWPSKAAKLVAWFMETGQYLIPDTPFQLSPWQKIVDPDLFKKAILFDISWGPSTPKNLYGALTADLERLRELFDENSESKEQSS